MSGLMRWSTAMLAGAAVATAAAADRPVALVNESASLPRGVYVRALGEPIKTGSIVAVPQPVQAQAYLASLGMPEDVLLLKRVAAVGGERVCARGALIETPRRRVVAWTRDQRGVRLGAWRECRVLRPDELFLLGDTPGSFDSRYFGPVLRRETTGVFHGIMTW